MYALYMNGKAWMMCLVCSTFISLLLASYFCWATCIAWMEAMRCFKAQSHRRADLLKCDADLIYQRVGGDLMVILHDLASKKASSHIAPLVTTSLPYKIHQQYIKVVYTLPSAPPSSLAIGAYQPKCSPRVPCRLTTIYSKEKRAVWRPWEDHIETYQRVLATLKE